MRQLLGRTLARSAGGGSEGVGGGELRDTCMNNGNGCAFFYMNCTTGSIKYFIANESSLCSYFFFFFQIATVGGR
jgi:hypothetical protein